MAFWHRWFKKEVPPETVQPNQHDRELVRNWIRNINDSISSLKIELSKIPELTVAEYNKSAEDRSREIKRKIDELPEKIVGPIRELLSLSKQEIMAELIRISSHHDAHDSHYSVDREAAKPIQEMTKELTGKQKKLLAILLDSGFLSYAEIGEKLGITHESAKNLVNRLLRDANKARLISKQETDQGITVGVSSEVQDEILKTKHRTTPNDST